jgi:hypothetical protein
MTRATTARQKVKLGRQTGPKCQADIRTCEKRIMGRIFVNIGLSLDGYLAPEGMTMENPGHKNWGPSGVR